MIPLEVGKTYEPPEQQAGIRATRTVTEIGETQLGTTYVAFLDLIEYRGVGVVSRQQFEDWVEGRQLIRSWDGGDD